MTQKKFEPAMKRLEALVASLEEGELPLEEALAAFEEGMKLAKFCSLKLEEAERKVTMLVEGADGGHHQVPFEPGQDKEGD